MTTKDETAPPRPSLGSNALRYDPIADEKKPYTKEEFVAIASNELLAWLDVQERDRRPRTWSEWMNGFINYMIW